MWVLGVYNLKTDFPDIDSLFFVKDPMYNVDLVLWQFLLTGVVLILLTYSLFNKRWVESKIEQIEGYILKKFFPTKVFPLISSVKESVFEPSPYENTLKISDKVIFHRGVYLLPSETPSSSVLNLIREIVRQWKGNILYIGRQEGDLVKEFLEKEETVPDFMEQVYMLYSLYPLPQDIRQALERVEPSVKAVIIEDVGYLDILQDYLENLLEISILHSVPVFIVGEEVSLIFNDKHGENLVLLRKPEKKLTNV